MIAYSHCCVFLYNLTRIDEEIRISEITLTRCEYAGYLLMPYPSQPNKCLLSDHWPQAVSISKSRIMHCGMRECPAVRMLCDNFPIPKAALNVDGKQDGRCPMNK